SLHRIACNDCNDSPTRESRLRDARRPRRGESSRLTLPASPPESADSLCPSKPKGNLQQPSPHHMLLHMPSPVVFPKELRSSGDYSLSKIQRTWPLSLPCLWL